MKFNTSLKSVKRAHKSPGEVNDGPNLVEPGQSLPLSFLIDRMMDSGVRKQVETALLRLTHFGPNEKIPDEFIDPTQNFNFNFAEAESYKRYLEAKIRGNKEKQEEILKEVKQRKEEEETETVVDAES